VGDRRRERGFPADARAPLGRDDGHTAADAGTKGALDLENPDRLQDHAAVDTESRREVAGRRQAIPSTQGAAFDQRSEIIRDLLGERPMVGGLNGLIESVNQLAH
jgi:hypothetical protein